MQKAETEAAPKGGKRGMVLAIVAVLLALGLGGGLYFWKSHHHAAAPKVVAKVEPVTLAVPTMMASLNAQDGRAVFARVTAQLQLNTPRDAEAAKAHMSQIEDLFQTYLHDTRPDELRGSWIYRLREAMLGQIANILAPTPVRDLFFTELLVQ